MAMEDSFKRLLSLSMETEIRLLTKEAADEEAIKVFAENLRQLLMASPLGQKNVLAIDPGYRPAARWCVWMPRENYCIIPPFTSANQMSKKNRRSRRLKIYAGFIISNALPSVTAPPDVKPKVLCVL